MVVKSYFSDGPDFFILCKTFQSLKVIVLHFFAVVRMDTYSAVYKIIFLAEFYTLKRRRHIRGRGSIPKLEEQKKALQEKYTSLEQKTQSLSDLRQNAIRAAEQKEKLSQELELHKKIEKRNRLRNLKDAANREKKADEEIAALTSIISVDGHMPTKEEISQIRAKCSTMDSLNVLFVKSLEAEKAAKVAMEDAEKEFQGNIFLEKYGSEEAADTYKQIVYGTDFCPPINLSAIDEYEYTISKIFTPDKFEDIYWNNCLRAFPKIKEYIGA